ncbi:10257_t:CDS:2, partial [Acaulospora colombiana]
MQDINKKSLMSENPSVQKDIGTAHHTQQDREQVQRVSVRPVAIAIQGSTFCDPPAQIRPTDFDWLRGSIMHPPHNEKESAVTHDSLFPDSRTIYCICQTISNVNKDISEHHSFIPVQNSKFYL